MADDEEPGLDAPAQEKKPFLDLRVVGVVAQQGSLIREDRGRLLEGHPVLGLIRGILATVPFEDQSAHAPSVYLRRMYGSNRLGPTREGCATER